MRYLLILLAIAVGAGIGLILARYNARAAETLVEEKPQNSLWPWIAGVAVLLAGLFFLADFYRAPIDSVYIPATSDNGTIRSGGFSTTTPKQ